MSLYETPIEFQDKRYWPWWSSPDHRQIAPTRQQCYRLVSFTGCEGRDSAALAKGRLVQVAKRFLANPGYQRNKLRELREWQWSLDAGYAGPLEDYLIGLRPDPLLSCFQYSRRKAPPLKEDGHYRPPDAWFLPSVSPEEATEIVSAVFGGSPDPTNPGLIVHRASLSSGDVLHCRDLQRCETPGNALAEFAAWEQEHPREMWARTSAEAAVMAVQLGVPFSIPEPPQDTPSPVPVPVPKSDAPAEPMNPSKAAPPEYSRGKLRCSSEFKDVWVGDNHYDLRTRPKARLCIQYLFEKRAFAPASARHLVNEIDPFVRKGGDYPRAAEIKIQHYFNSQKGKLPELCKQLIGVVHGKGRYFLKVE